MRFLVIATVGYTFERPTCARRFSIEFGNKQLCEIHWRTPYSVCRLEGSVTHLSILIDSSI
jgi:hypothetical protein